MAPKTIFFDIAHLFMLISEKRSVSDSQTFRKNNGEKSASESSKMREKQILHCKDGVLAIDTSFVISFETCLFLDAKSCLYARHV